MYRRNISPVPKKKKKDIHSTNSAVGGSISERIKREVRRVGQEQSEIKGIWRTGGCV